MLMALAFALLIGFSAAATVFTMRAHDDDETLIDLFGDQYARMQSMVWLALSEPESPELTPLALSFEHNLHTLGRGGRVVDAAGETVMLPPATGLVSSHLEAASETWAILRNRMEELAALQPDDPDRSRAAQALQAEALALADQLTAALNSLEAQSHVGHDRLITIQIAFVALGLLVLVWGFFLTRRGILQPLAVLGRVAWRIGQGHLFEPVPALRDDEFGDLARSMEAMRSEIATAQRLLDSRVAERTRELTVAFEFSQDITRQLESERLFESITARARSLMQAEAASLCLVTPDGKGVRLASHAGQKARGTNLRQPASKDPTLQVLGEGQTVLTDVAQSACTFLDADPRDQCLAAPLQIGDHNIGAICILRGSRAPFEEEEKRALTLLANSAAIAIANAHLLESERRHAEQTAAAAEREHLAAELHDHLAQTLSFLNLKTDRVAKLLVDAQPAAATAELRWVKSAIEEAYAQVRAALSGLAQPSHTSEDFAQRLAAYVAEYQQTTGLRVDVNVSDASIEALPPLIQKQALYIVREALTNVRRHASAKSVRVQSARADETVRLTIEDDGRGFDPQLVEKEGHLGLAIMQTRAERCGGHVTVESAPGAGTRVIACFPLAASDGDNTEETV